MNLTLVVVGIVVVLLLAAVAVLKAKFTAGAAGATADSTDGPTAVFDLRRSLLSPAERSFAGVLDGALPEGYTWMAKIRLGDLVVTKKGLSASQRASAWNRVNQKHVDFVLLRVSDFAPVVGIELDDKSHDADDRKSRDAFVDAVAQSAGLPLLHIPAQAAYNQGELRAEIAAALAPRSGQDRAQA